MAEPHWNLPDTAEVLAVVEQIKPLLAGRPRNNHSVFVRLTILAASA